MEPTLYSSNSSKNSPLLKRHTQFNFFIPADLFMEIFSYLSFYDIAQCTRVNHLWKRMSESQALWSKLGIKMISQCFLKIVNSNVSYKLQFRELKQMIKDYDTQMIMLFGGLKKFYQLPTLKLEGKHSLSYEGGIQLDKVSAPIMRGKVYDREQNREVPFITLRHMGESTGHSQVYLAYLYRFYFTNDHTTMWTLQSGQTHSSLTRLKLSISPKHDPIPSYLKKLIRNKRCGHLDLQGKELPLTELSAICLT
jgi:hypothetical protein